MNFKFNNRFRGLELQGDVGIAELGDAETYSASATYGGSFAEDRARVFLSGSYLERGTASQFARPFFDNVDGTSSPTSGLIIQSGSNPFGFGRPGNVAAFRNLFGNTYGTSIPGVSSSYLVNSDGTIIGRDGALNLRDTGPEPVVRPRLAVRAAEVEGRRRIRRHYADYRSRLRPELMESIADITCPTAIIWGDKDRWCPPSIAVELAAAIESAELTRFPNGGHFSPEGEALGVLTALQALLDRPLSSAG